MNISRRSFVQVTVLLFVLGISVAFVLSKDSSKSARPNSLTELPPVVLWAWEQPADLRFLKPEQVGVAFLAQTIHLRGDDVIVRPRMQTLRLPEEIKLIAVTRIETVGARLSEEQAEQSARAISRNAGSLRISAVQIDFDATRSEQNFYRDLIVRLRRQLPAGTALSITALSSWCAGDDWLAGLPIDEAVPMLFRMGPDHQTIHNRLASGNDFVSGLCRQSYGISTDESPPQLLPSRRRYVFNPDQWTEQSVRNVLESMK